MPIRICPIRPTSDHRVSSFASAHTYTNGHSSIVCTHLRPNAARAHSASSIVCTHLWPNIAPLRRWQPRMRRCYDVLRDRPNRYERVPLCLSLWLCALHPSGTKRMPLSIDLARADFGAW